jgi:heptosyltransferase II
MSAVARRGSAATIVVLAPNWLGDAVLALPAIADVRRAYAGSRLAVAARRSIAGIFRLMPDVDEVIALESDARWWRRTAFRADAAAVARFDVAILFPNSFQSAWLVRAAGVPERCGYGTDVRGRLLTRAVARTRGGHQSEYYQRLTSALGIAALPASPRIDVPAPVTSHAADLLREHGHVQGRRLVVFAPGAAYGKAKQWLPSHVASLVARLALERDATCVIVGSAADAGTAREIRRGLVGDASRRVIDLVGRTSLEQLAGVLAGADACVCNDSGAMHLAAAVGVPVVATFGPTNERATAPLARPGRSAEVIAHDVWCRPCMLRECPVDHRCMRGISPDRVFDAVARVLA